MCGAKDFSQNNPGIMVGHPVITCRAGSRLVQILHYMQINTSVCSLVNKDGPNEEFLQKGSEISIIVAKHQRTGSIALF